MDWLENDERAGEPVALVALLEPELVRGPGKLVRVPSTLIWPPVADTGMENVWLDVIRGAPPGVKVVEPATRLLGLPVKPTPSML